MRDEQKDYGELLHLAPLTEDQLSEEPTLHIEAQTEGELTAKEERLLLHTFCDTEVSYPADQTITELFEAQVKRTPDAIAVIFEDRQLTYAQLNARANQLAWALRNRGIQAGDFVAILAQRGLELLIAVYGVLKTGGAYVPMDPAYPEDRLQYILEDCKPKAILTYGTELSTDIPTIDLAADRLESEKNPPSVNNPNDLAYLIYTSGTTGKPKGVMIEHRNVVNYCTRTGLDVLRYAKGEPNSILSVTNLVFDIFVTEGILSLLNGMTVVLANEEAQTNAEAFCVLEEKHRADILQTTPSRLRMYLAQDPQCPALRHFKYIMLGGENVPELLVLRLQGLCPETTIVDVYGPSETTVWSTCCDVTDGTVNIGKPISNTQIYVLNGTKLCSIGETGELCIGGAGLARGYLNRPELTAEKFIDNPFREGKIYRTGDLAAWMPDGNLQFLGRVDEQIKIRGYRVELGEIDSVLRSVFGVRDSAVIIREDAEGEKDIFAYVVGKEPLDLDGIREEMRKALPEYMIPSYMAQIDAIPVTRNGKLDKKALPEIRERGAVAYVAPRNETEALLCELFCKILGADRIGIQDSFFRQGGHSLRAAKLVNWVEEATGCRLSMQDIFSCQTPELLAQRMTEKQGNAYVAIPKAEEQEYYPMSSAQKRMYLVCRMDEGSTAYHLPSFWRIKGSFQPERMKAALQMLVMQHEILRTEFLMVDGAPMQRVLPFVQAPFDYEEDTETSEEVLLRAFVRPFDLSKAPLLRMKVIKRRDSWLLLMDEHHIISDGISTECIRRELAALYNGEPLSPVTLQYKDYSQWMTGRDLSAQKAFWLEQFRQPISSAEVPLDFKRQKTMSHVGGSVHSRLDAELAHRLRGMAKQQGVTEYMVFLSALMVLLGKYSQQEDIVIGSAFSGRTHRDTEHMPGMFVNTLPLRGKPVGEKLYAELLAEMKELCVKAYENQDYPFDELVEAIGLQRDPSRNPLFDVMMAMQSHDGLPFALDQAEVRQIPPVDIGATFDLTFNIEEKDLQYEIVLEYCSDLYKKETAQQILTHYLSVLNQITWNPKQCIREIKIITEQEEARVLSEFNTTEVPFPEDQTIVSLFEAQVDRTPERTAVIFEHERMTYAQLNRRANRLAWKLRTMGVHREDFVAILAERGPRLLTAVYGVLKAGGAYVPMDPGYPEDRLQYILEDCKPKAILTYGTKIETEIPVIDLAEELPFDESNPTPINEPSDLAYLIYTSGTTGKPKGVMIEHRNVINYCSRTGLDVYRYAACELNSILSVTNLVFDIFVTEGIASLLNGMTVILANEDAQTNAEAFLRLQGEHKAQVLQTTPSRLKMYLSQNPQCAELKYFKYIMIGGEKVSERLVEQLKAICPETTIVDVYGPSETTVWSTCRDVIPGIVSIGKPISNTQVYILNGQKLCRIGEQGELCIGGAGLARGYLNRPELTAEKFIKNPFGEGRIYRTGDIAKWLPDGNLKFIGRVDEQIKIRGFRVELGEIDAVLRSVEGIRNCAVIVREDSSGEKAICAYAVSRQTLDFEWIREEMRKVLPEYMIPTYMAQIDAIPVTKNGKLNKKALPEIKERSAAEYTAPRNIMEEFLCNVFSEILGVERVGIRDSFFRQGGHSLRSAKLVNRIEEMTGCRISMREIFACQTPERIARWIAEQNRENSSDITVAEVRDLYPLAPAQKRMYLVCRMDEDSTAYNLPTAWQVEGDIDPEQLQTALQRMLDRHEILRTEFILEEGEPMQRVLPRVEADFLYVEDGDTPKKELLREFIRPFDLSKAPLVRMKLIKRTEGYLLLMDEHHIISDDISGELFRQELASLYNGEELKPLRLQYKDFSEWTGKRELAEQKRYWVESFDGEVPILDFPTDFTRPQTKSYRGEMVWQKVEENIAQRLRRLAKKQDATEYMVFLSAVMVLLSKYSRQEDVVVGSAFSGRTHRDTEAMLGMFVNTLALRGRPESSKEYTDFLEEIKELCMRAHENQEYPFEELVEALKLRRDASRNPLFDVMLVVHNNERDRFRLGDAVIEPQHAMDTGATFDLTFSVEEIPDSYAIGLQYAADLFRSETAERILHHYIALLAQLTAEPERKLSEFGAVTEQEERQILNVFNDTQKPYPELRTIAELFEEQVLCSAERVAVICGKQQLTYGQLNCRANQLAHKLRTMGVKPNDMVAVMTRRSTEMIVAIYGILKSGGAYVPIDPTYPAERIAYMLEDCKPKAMVVFGFEPNTSLPVIDLREMDTWTEPVGNPKTVSVPSDLAYCIYTSGTSGKPKGVLVEHHGVANLKAYFGDRFQISPEDRVLQFANYVFDGSVWEMNMALLHGARLIISEDNLDIPAFERTFREQGITVASLPPNFYVQLHDVHPRILVTAGSAADHIVLEKARGSRYINSYGPTECTVAATHWEPEGDYSVIPIGKPIQNAKVYILQGTKLCGIGVPGELCIAGAGLARGYLNLPELTAERFVPNPFGEGRIYRTGDLARWMPDGNIEFLGRVDEQVKIRGFRVELSEIETVLRRVPGIKDCAVIVRKDSTGDNAIFAYIVEEIPTELEEIRGTMRNALPEYMIPAYMMRLERIPVTTNGKLDKRALLEIEAKSDSEYIPPRNPAERAICNAFAAVFGMECISVKDHFFELGGDSIKAIRAVSKLREHGYVLAVKDIMSNGTVECIASYAVPLEVNRYSQNEVNGFVPATPVMELFRDWSMAKPNHFNQAVMLPVEGDAVVLKGALDALVLHHDILRSVYRNGQLKIRPTHGTRLYDWYSYDLTEELLPAQRIEAMCTRIQEDMDLEHGPLVKAALFQTRDGSYLLLCIHHLLVDGVSWHILTEDFRTAEKQLREGKPIQLPMKTASFVQWAELLEEYRHTELLAAERPYWEAVAKQIPLCDFRLPREFVGKRARVVTSLTEEQTEQLLYEASEAYNTQINDLLLAAMGMAVGDITGQERIALCLEGHGRQTIHKEVDIDRTVGWFTCAYPVIVECASDAETAIINTKEMLRVIPNHGLGYGLLPDLDRSAPICIYFNYLGETEPTPYPYGECVAEENRYAGEINFNGALTDGVLSFELTCDRATFSERTAQRLADAFRDRLAQIIALCAGSEESRKTFADVDADDLEDEDFDEINAILGLF